MQLGVGIRFPRPDRFGTSVAKNYRFPENNDRSVNRKYPNRGFGAPSDRFGLRFAPNGPNDFGPCIHRFNLASGSTIHDHLHVHGQDGVFYEEPDLSGRVEGVDYLIHYGADDEEEETE